MSEGVVVVDTVGSIRYVNPVASRLLYPDLQGSPRDLSFLDYLADDDSKSWVHLHLSKLSQLSGCIRLKRSNLDSLEVNARMAPLKEGGAAVAIFLATKEADEATAFDRARRLTEVFDSVNIGLIEENADGIIQEVNPKFCEIVGRARADLIGLKFQDISETSDAVRQTKLHAQLVEGKIQSYTLTKRYVRPDGTEVWAEKTVSTVSNDKGRPIHIMGIVHDVSEQRKLASQLEESQLKLEMVLEASSVGLWFTDLATRETSWSEATKEHLGVHPEEPCTEAMFARYAHPDDLHKLMHAFESSIESDEPFAFEFRTVSWDKRERWVSSRGRVVKDDHGLPVRFIGVTTDITAVRQAESAARVGLENDVLERTEELIRANQQMESFCYSISHDLRTPLRAIVASSQMLLRDFDGLLDDVGRDHLHRQSAAAKRMAILIDDLLHLSRIGRAPLNIERIDVTSLANSVSSEIGLNPGSLEVSPGITLRGDVRLIRILFHAFFTNSMKFVKPGRAPQVVVTQKADGTIEVRDSGIGFDQRYVDKVFLPFQRLVSDSDYPGTGIGLANARIVVERHSGRIWADGRPGDGASFYVQIPD